MTLEHLNTQNETLGTEKSNIAYNSRVDFGQLWQWDIIFIYFSFIAQLGSITSVQ